MRCEFLWTVDMRNGYRPNEPQSAVGHCTVHNYSPVQPFSTTDQLPLLCPIGKIEEAVEKGAKHIDGIVEKYLKEKLTANERAESERRRRLQLEEEIAATKTD